MPISYVANLVRSAVLAVGLHAAPVPTQPVLVVDLCDADPTLVICEDFECDSDADCYDKCVDDMTALGFSPVICVQY